MKLSAYGRIELARVKRVNTTPGEPAAVIGGVRVPPTPSRTVRAERVLLSDGVVATKHTWLKPDGKVDHSTGWTRLGKLKPALLKELKTDRDAYASGWLERYEAKGWSRA